MIWDVVVPTPLGPFGIALDAAGRVLRAAFLPPGARPAQAAAAPAAARAAARAVAAYFEDPHDPGLAAVPLAAPASPFQARLRALLRALPPGRTVTYAEAARRLASAPRAVGAALRANPVPLFVPCHRVVAAGGLGGYAGAGPRLRRVKAALLAHEGVSVPEGA